MSPIPLLLVTVESNDIHNSSERQVPFKGKFVKGAGRSVVPISEAIRPDGNVMERLRQTAPVILSGGSTKGLRIFTGAVHPKKE
jgi:hypothetical protein